MPDSRRLPPFYFQASILILLALHFLAPVAQVVPGPWRFLGLVLVAAGLGLNVWADALFKRHQTTVKPFQAPSRLVVEGPFRYSRHPMYLGMVLALLGLAVFFGTATPFAVPLGFGLLMQFRFIREEEQDMLRTFGRDYQEYRRRVRAWL